MTDHRIEHSWEIGELFLDDRGRLSIVTSILLRGVYYQWYPGSGTRGIYHTNMKRICPLDLWMLAGVTNG